MARKFKVRRDRKLYIDWEMTCWEGPPPPGQKSEIIEIGIVEVDIQKLEIIQSASFFIKNTLSSVSDYCSNLTKITQSMLDKQGRPLNEVLGTLEKKFGTRNKSVSAWGSDEEAIERDCLEKQIAEPPFSRAFVNLGLEFSLMMGADRSIGLQEALEILGEDLEPDHHRALPDAIAAAKVDMALIRHFRQHLSFNHNITEPKF